MIQVTWHLAVLITFELLWLIYALTRDSQQTWLGSNREWAIILYIVGNIAIIPIYGGIFWW